MIFHPQNVVKTGGSFVFSKNMYAFAQSCLNKDIIKEFWFNYTAHCSALEITETDEYVFSIGTAEKLSVDDYDYTINITASGMCISARDEKALIHGFMTLIDQFKVVDDRGENEIRLECCQIRERALIENRMIHFCVFPETELWELRKFLRFCAALKFTHVIIEFWGMLQFDCMKELGWKNAYTKDEVRPIINEARELGLEIIPMFNHWGHAAGSRAIHGKHVVLDQNPALATLFSVNGWCWAIEKPKVKALLKSVREELIELCGDGGYFHIGCDEADGFVFNDENNAFICDYLNEICEELSTVGRRAIAWGDMFLYAHREYNAKNRYICHAPSEEVENYFLSNLDKRIVIADWQYHPKDTPIETSLTFKKAGFDCLVCPFDEDRKTIDASVETVKEYELYGFIHTTWHTLSIGIKYVPTIAIGAFEDVSERTENPIYNSAYVMRRANFANGDYEKGGWAKKQIEDIT
jgi:hypothetical protein